MKLINFLILVVLGFLVACKPTASPKIVTLEERQALSPATVQLATLPTEKAATDDEDLPAATPTEELVEISQDSPLPTPAEELVETSQEAATAVPESAAVGSEAESGGRRAVFPNTIIVYQRAGRFPGSPQQWTIYHTGLIKVDDGTEWQFPATAVELLFDLVEAPDFWMLDKNYTPDGECLDCLAQTLNIYYEGEIKEIAIVQEPPDLPENLKQVLDQINGLVSGNLAETISGGQEEDAAGSKGDMALPDEAVIVYRREGGLAGIMEQWTIFPDGRIEGLDGTKWRMTPQAVAELVEAIERTGFFEMEANYIPSNTCCDRFTYEITVRNGDETHTVTTIDAASNAPQTLWQTIDAIGHLIVEAAK